MDLPVSKEMMDVIKARVLDQTSKNIWNDFWVDEIGSELARPKSASIFVADHALEAEVSSTESPTFYIDDATAEQKLEHARHRFNYNSKAHAAACRLQRVWRLHLFRVNEAASRVQALVRAFFIRRHNAETHALRHSAAVMIQAAFYGSRDRRYCAFLRNVAWNRASVLCQRGARRWLARRRVERIKSERRFRGANGVQKIFRGLKGRRVALLRRAQVRDQAARSIQNCARWVNFRRAYANYRFMFVSDVEDCQRVVRGFMGRQRFKKYLAAWHAARNIQRVARGRMGRLRFDRKMGVVRAACITIQVRARGMRDRRLAAESRTQLIHSESERTALEDLACTRALRRGDDYLLTRAGKLEYRKAKDYVKAQLKSMRLSLANFDPSKRLLLDSRSAVRRIDTRLSGYINREQFAQLMKDTFINLSVDQLAAFWADTGGAHGKKGGYRLCDAEDQREFSEIADWLQASAESFKRGGVHTLGLRISAACKAMFGGNVNALARNKVYHRIRSETLRKFRAERPPPFACPDCNKRFIFSYELERHRGISVDLETKSPEPITEAGQCRGLYWCKQLGDAWVIA